MSREDNVSISSVAVFCGSGVGTQKVYGEEAYSLGKFLARHGVSVVYGGAEVGLMGAVADGALDNQGKVIGVLPDFLGAREIAHKKLTQLIMVETMHQRKEKIAQLSHGFLALPGGYGTMEELFEVLTWGHLGLHQKPIGILNTGGFYDPLVTMLHSMVDQGFLKEQSLKTLHISDEIDLLWKKMTSL